MALFPQIAASTFKTLGHLKEMKNIYKMTKRKLQKISDPISRAQHAYKKVDEFTNEVLDDEIVQKHLQCKKGCSACCHTQVSITHDEGALLAKIIEDGFPVDWHRLYRQKEAGNSFSEYFKIPYEERKCIFLDSEGGCSIYENRSMVCRTNNVVSPAANCDTRVETRPTIRLINTHKSNMVIYSAFEVSSGGTLPKVLWDTLEKAKKVPLFLGKRP
ncbi:MAG: YkgJ family cysteine cluster protein [Bacteriovoracaceae bacterium]